MKRISYITILFFVGMVSCKKKDLELFPYNQIETSQAFNTEGDVTLAVNGMYAGIRNSGSYYMGTWNIVADVLADNLITNRTGRGTLRTFGEWRYTGESTYGLFSDGYSITRRANAILENIDKFADGAFKNDAKGQALAIRAMTYFDMSRVYSKTYQNATATDSTLPYVTTTESTIKPSKEPVTGFYEKVIADLELAKNLISNKAPTLPVDVYSLKKASVNGLLARVYLYKGDWAKCIQAATDALAVMPSLGIMGNFPGIWTDANKDGVLFAIRNTILDGNNNLGVNYYQTVSGERKSEYNVDWDFYQTFATTDIRKSAYFATSSFNGVSYNHVIKYAGRSGGAAGVLDAKVIRTAEVLLSRAEAYYRSGNLPLALADVVTLKTNRYVGYVPETAATLTGAALLTEIYNQRRLELAFEGDRFWDLKRRNLPVTRNATKGERADGTGTPYVFATLPAGDKRFLLPYPVTETNFNTNLTQNPGY